MMTLAQFKTYLQVFNITSGGGGGGDVTGPGSSTDRGIVIWDGTTGLLVASSDVIIDMSGNITTPGVIHAAGFVGPIEGIQTTTNYTTATTVTAAAIVGGVIIITPPDGDQAFTFDTAANIYAAMGSPALNTFINCKVINKSFNFQSYFFNSDSNLLLSGFPIEPYLMGQQGWDLSFQVTQVTPSVQITVNGGTNIAILNILGGEASNIGITYSTVDSTPIGETTPSTGTFTTVTTNNLTVNFTAPNPVNLPFNTPYDIYVNLDGSDANNGSQYNPVLTIAQGIGLMGDNQILNIGQYVFNEGALTPHAITTWVGNGQNNTFISSGGITLPGNWTAFIGIGGPTFQLQNLSISDSVGVNLVAPGWAPNSVITLSSTTIQSGTNLSIGLMNQVLINQGTIATNPVLNDIAIFRCIASQLFGTLTINGTDATDVPTQNYLIDGSELTTLTIVATAAVNLTVTILNSPSLTTLNSTAGSATITYNFDGASYPTTLNLTGSETVNELGRFPDKVSNTIYVSPQGSDTQGNGRINNPYATISHAASTVISTATPTNVYTISVMGNITDSGQVYVSPNINVFAISANVGVTLTNPIMADPAWATASIGFSYSYWQNLAIYGNGINLDFSSFSSSIFPFVQFIQMYFTGGLVTINGNPTSQYPGTAVYFYQCYDGYGLMADNVYVYSADSQWFGEFYLGTGTATNCVEYYSFGDYIAGTTIFQDSLTTQCYPIFQSTGTALTEGMQVTSSSGAVSAMSVTIVGTTPQAFTFSASGTGNGSINATINGSGQLSTVTVNDTSTSGTNVNLTLDGKPATLTVTAGTPVITYLYYSDGSTIKTNYIQGYSGDLRINPFASGQAVYVGHDFASTFVYVGAGSTSTLFQVLNTANNLLLVQNSGSVTTKNNTLDDGSGSATIVKTATIREMGAPLPLVKFPVSKTATSGTLLNGEVVGGIIVFTPSAPATWTLPAATDLDSILQTPDASRGLRVRMLNTSSFTVTILAGTNTTLSGFITGSLVIPAMAEVNVDLVKIATTPAYTLFGAPSGGGGSAELAANNVFTGVNVFTNTTAPTQFEAINASYAGINGPSVITSSAGFAAAPSAPLTTSSFTLTGSQVVNMGVILNGSLSTQLVFMPTAANFEAALLVSFPSGGSIPTFTAYWMRVVNQSTTATATLNANTDFLINNTATSTFAPGQRDTVLIVKTSNSPVQYTVY